MTEDAPHWLTILRRPPVLAAAAAALVALVFFAGLAVGRLHGQGPSVEPVSTAPQAATSIVPEVPPDQPAPLPQSTEPAPAPEPPPVAAKPVAKPKPQPRVVDDPPDEPAAKPKPVAKAKPPEAEAPKPAAKAAPQPAPVEGGRWIIQLGAYQSADYAKLLANTLEAHGQPVAVSQGQDKAGKTWYFVRTPGYATRDAAETIAKHLAQSDGVPTYIIPLTAP